MGVEVFPKRMKKSLQYLNKNLELIIEKSMPLKESIKGFIGEEDLQSRAFGSQKDYMNRGHIPALDRQVEMLNQFIDVNNAHMRYIDSYLAGETYLSEERLINQIDNLRFFITRAERLKLYDVEAVLRKRQRVCKEKLQNLQQFASVTATLYSGLETTFASVTALIARLEGAIYDSITGAFVLPPLGAVSKEEVMKEWELKQLLKETYGFAESEIEIMLKLYAALEKKCGDDASRIFLCLIGSLRYGDKENRTTTQIAWAIIAEAYPDLLLKEILLELELSEAEYMELEYAVIMQNAITSSGMSVEDYISMCLNEEEDELDATALQVRNLLTEKMKERFGITYEEIQRGHPEITAAIRKDLEKFFEKGDFAHMCITAATILNDSPIKEIGNLSGVFNGIFDVDKNAGYVGDAYGTNGAPPSMGGDDYISDLDAVNIAKRIKDVENPNVIEIMEDYYSEIKNGETNRATEFLENIGEGDVEIGKHDILEEAKGYLNRLEESNFSEEVKQAYREEIQRFIVNVLHENNTY